MPLVIQRSGFHSFTADQTDDTSYNAAPQVSLNITVTDELPPPIPTLSLWGLMAMFLVLLGIGGMIVQRKTPG